MIVVWRLVLGALHEVPAARVDDAARLGGERRERNDIIYIYIYIYRERER